MDNLTGLPVGTETPPTRSWWKSRRALLLLVVPAGIAALVFSVSTAWRAWDNPQPGTVTLFSGLLLYKGNPIRASVECSCPPHFIESRSQDVQLIISLKKQAQPNEGGPQRTGPGRPGGSSPGGVHEAPPKDLAASDPELWVSTWIEASRTDVTFQGGYSAWDLGTERQLVSGLRIRVPVRLTPRTSDRIQLTLQGYDRRTKEWTDSFDPGTIEWPIDSRPPFLSAIAPFLYSILVFVLTLTIALVIDNRFRQLRRRTERQLSDVRERAAGGQPETHFVWETARIKLEAYLDRNLIQVNLVFWLAVLVMAVGFGFVLAGVCVSLNNPKDFSSAALAAIAGIITQFIGATFLVIYRSTMRQANDFMSVLERINTVGMAVHELDRIPDVEGDLKNQVRAKLVQSLIEWGRGHSTQRDESADGQDAGK